MNKKRLLKLADYLENKVRDDKFDLWYFAKKEIGAKCISAACALGYCPNIFKGVKLSWTDYSTLAAVIYTDKDGVAHEDLGAGTGLFDISSDACEYLFVSGSYPERYRGRKSVARRIKTFVATNGYIPSYSERSYKISHTPESINA